MKPQFPMILESKPSFDAFSMITSFDSVHIKFIPAIVSVDTKLKREVLQITGLSWNHLAS